jgi:hypothetical protein
MFRLKVSLFPHIRPNRGGSGLKSSTGTDSGTCAWANAVGLGYDSDVLSIAAGTNTGSRRVTGVTKGYPVRSGFDSGKQGGAWLTSRWPGDWACEQAR